MSFQEHSASAEGVQEMCGGLCQIAKTDKDLVPHMLPPPVAVVGPPAQFGAPLGSSLSVWCNPQYASSVAVTTVGLGLYNVSTSMAPAGSWDLVAIGTAVLILWSIVSFGTNAATISKFTCLAAAGLFVLYVLYSFVF